MEGRAKVGNISCDDEVLATDTRHGKPTGHREDIMTRLPVAMKIGWHPSSAMLACCLGGVNQHWRTIAAAGARLSGTSGRVVTHIERKRSMKMLRRPCVRRRLLLPAVWRLTTKAAQLDMSLAVWPPAVPFVGESQHFAGS